MHMFHQVQENNKKNLNSYQESFVILGFVLINYCILHDFGSINYLPDFFD